MNRIILGLMFIITSFIYSQNRTNDQLPIILKTSGQILTAKGWLKNESGQWVSRNNKIISDLGKDTKVLENYQKYSIGNDNFIAFEINEIIIKRDTCILLSKKYKDGYYKYETIEEGWNPKNSYKYYVLSKNEFSKIKHIEQNNLNSLHLDVICMGDIKYVDLKTFTKDKIAREIAKKIKDNYDLELYKLGVNISYFKSKNIVQFYFYDFMNGLDPQDNSMYYETDLINFSKFINVQF